MAQLVDQEAWLQLILANANMNTRKKFNEEYIIYYRHTRFTPPYEFKKCSLDWCLLRGYSNNPSCSSEKQGDSNPMIECCISIYEPSHEPGYERVSFRIFNDRFGRHQIVLEKKSDVECTRNKFCSKFPECNCLLHQNQELPQELTKFDCFCDMHPSCWCPKHPEG